jgi:FMN phosphatase YigB (HAD superfamily)
MLLGSPAVSNGGESDDERPRAGGGAAPVSLVGVRVVSWDVDGTLYPLGGLRRAIVRRMAAAWLRGAGPRAWRGLQAWRRARARLEARRRGPGMGDGREDLGGDLPGREAPAEEVAARALFEEELLLPALATVGPRPDVGAVLHRIAGWGLQQVVFSDYAAEGKLRALGLSRYFAGCYCGEALGAPKPSAEALRKIARDFQVTPAQMLHIGDREDTDGAAAAGFGCRSLVLERDFRDFSTLAASLCR